MTNLPPPLLSPVEVDFYSIQEALAADLVSLDSWRNFAKAGTGQTLIRWLATIASDGKGANARTLQELFTDTARSPSAIFRIMRMLGAHIIRARSGTANASLQRTDASASSLVIPAYTQWNVGGQDFFNRTVIVLPGTGAAVDTVLYRGKLTYESYTSLGAGFQKFSVGSASLWNVCDDDIFVTDSLGAVWRPIRTGLWREPGTAKTFYENTLPDGRVEIKFGDGTYGGILPAGGFTVTYPVLDTASNTQASPEAGSQALPTGLPVVGTLTSSASANLDPPPPAFYKFMGPGAVANFERAVTRDDHRAIALRYPGVVDATFLGQAEVNPSDIRQMNIIHVVLLTSTPWTSTDWFRFKTFMERDRTIASTTIVRRDAKPVDITIPIKIEAFPTADLPSLEDIVKSTVRDFFAQKAGSLGASYYPSDLIVAIKEQSTYQQAPNESGDLIDTISVPMDPVLLPPTAYFNLVDVTVAVSYSLRTASAASLSQTLGV